MHESGNRECMNERIRRKKITKYEISPPDGKSRAGNKEFETGCTTPN